MSGNSGAGRRLLLLSLPGMKCYIHPAIAELAGDLMQKQPCASVQRLHSVLLTPGFLICIAFVVAGGGRRLKVEAVPKFNT